ncbi:uncharacterized protein LOC119070855 [Bradysia coprophila]|uniref:uncharacterized protein LOC119070855 n=1 Tax=Bradysia coprophila TaxID=38358 RepID=UPI00187D93CD|nr:uncharacterized protein LOC119070855 [Bradysia coprophila]
MDKASLDWVSQMVKEVQDDPGKMIEMPPENLCNDATLKAMLNMAMMDTVATTARNVVLLFAIRMGDDRRLSPFLRATLREKLCEATTMPTELKFAYLSEATRICSHPRFKAKLAQLSAPKTARRQLAASLAPNQSATVEQAVSFGPSFAAVLCGAAPPPVKKTTEVKENIVYIVYEGKFFFLLFIFKLDI